MKRFVIPLRYAEKDLEIEIGAYAATLGEVMQAGFPLVDGFIVTPEAYFDFLHKNKLIKKINEQLSVTNFEHSDSLMQTATHIKNIITNTPFPEELAREMHTAYKTLAGLVTDTSVNIISGNKGEVLSHTIQGDSNLLVKIKECWAKYFLPEQLLFHHKNNLDYFINGPSLIIQKHIEPEITGVLLTGNPVTNDTSQLIIEVTGVHEHYEIQKNTLKITNQTISTKTPHISLDHVLQLATWGKKLEELLYFGQEIYWMIHKQTLYIARYKQLPFHHSAQKDTSLFTTKYPLLTKGTGVSMGLTAGSVKRITAQKDFHTISSGDIIVATDIPHVYMSTIKKAAAVVIEQPGRTSPVALTARQYAIPAVVGVKNALTTLKTNQLIYVNGGTGEIFANTIAASLHKTATRLYLTLSSDFALNDIADETYDGIVLEGGSVTDTARFEEKIFQLCKQVMPHPVLYKISDFDGPQTNRLGFRGTHRALYHTSFKNELALIKKLREKKDLKNLWLMLPFVRSKREFFLAKEIITDARLHRDTNFKLWITIATPANIFNIEELVTAGIDGIYIDIDELTMLLTGVDDMISEVSHIFDPLDTAVLSSLEIAIKTAHKHGIASTITGRSLSFHPSLIEKAILWGVTNICAYPEATHKLRKKIVTLEQSLLIQ